MDLNQRLSILNQGTTAAGRAAPGEMELASLASMAFEAGAPILVAGMVTGLKKLFAHIFHDDAEGNAGKLSKLATATEQVVKSEVPIKDPEVSDCDLNDYYVGCYAGGGDPADLRELIRRAKHRDGSTAAIATSDDASNLLASAFDSHDTAMLASQLAGNGFTLPFFFGNHPPGSASAFGATGMPHNPPPPAPAAAVPPPPAPAAPAPAPAAPAAVTPAAPAAAAAPAPVAIAPAAGSRASADLVSGRVNFGGVLIPVKDAEEISYALLEASRFLLRPNEGYSWVDNMRDPLMDSTLVLHDVAIAPGLPETDLGGLKRAEVYQKGDGRYAAVIFLRNGTTRAVAQGQLWDDMTAAKVVTAGEVRSLGPED